MLLELIAEMLTLIGGLLVIYFVYVFLTRKDGKYRALRSDARKGSVIKADRVIGYEIFSFRIGEEH